MWHVEKVTVSQDQEAQRLLLANTNVKGILDCQVLDLKKIEKIKVQVAK